MLGVLVNTVAILVGGSVGLLVNKGIPKRFSAAIMTGIGLCTLYIGVSGSLQGENLIVLGRIMSKKDFTARASFSSAVNSFLPFFSFRR